MQILIKYEASWRNSFLDGTNNEALPKNGRGFVGSIKKLGDKNPESGLFENFLSRGISHDTVMGIINRLIGDQRKLYQARSDKNYYFLEIDDEEKVKFKNIEQNSSEMIYIRNITGSTDQNSFSGMIKGSDPIFNSDYSKSLWGVLFLEFHELCNFINDKNFSISTDSDFDPLSIVNRFEKLGKLKVSEISEITKKAILELQNRYPDIKYLDDKDNIKPLALYCSALYLQVFRLSQKFDLSNSLTKNGLISGIAKGGSFTMKDFMDKFTTGDKKIVWGNPYLLKERRKGEGEVSSILTKSSGTLEIQIDIPKEKAKQLEEMIENAGVSSFYLGKKGLAYVEEITI
jgi:hypothetical protein